MSPTSTRCRHIQVNWTSSHSCQCQNCGKSGHWFEKEGLVMWLRDEALGTRTMATGIGGPIDRNRSASAVSSKAG